MDVASITSELEKLKAYKEETDSAKVKWDKEREQLKMHNQSLSKELMQLMMSDDGSANDNNDKSGKESKEEAERLRREVDSLKKQLKEVTRHQDTTLQSNDNTPKEKELTAPTIESLPVYKPPAKIDASAGRELWCVLCERDGHESIDCPFELPPPAPEDTASNGMNMKEPVYF